MLTFLRYSTFGLLVTLLVGCAPDDDPLRPITNTFSVARQPDDGLQALEWPPEPSGWTSDETGQRQATAPATLKLLASHGDLSLSFDYRLSADGAAQLLLNDRYAVDLSDLSVRAISDSIGSGRMDPGEPTGRWRHLELSYVAPAAERPALLMALYLDGNLIHYQQTLLAEAEIPQTEALRIELTSGSLAIQDPRLANRAGRKSTLAADGAAVLRVPLLHYAYYDLPENTQDFRGWDQQAPDRTGYTEVMDLDELRGDRSRDYGIRFTGQLDVPVGGKYIFRHWGPASGRLYLNDELVLDHGGKHAVNSVTDSAELEAGTYDFRFDYVQNHGWNVSRLFARSPGGREEILNALDTRESVARPTTTGPMVLVAEERPYLLRSFVYFPQPKMYQLSAKRTHAISVGHPEGVHYTIDLASGALLRVWRGGFANVREMWYDRGEPQTVTPLEPVRALSGRPQWTSSENEPWPDSLASGKTDFRHFRYELDEAGYPTFHYATANGRVTDRIVPADGGLERTLTNHTEQETSTLLASGSDIIDEGEGRFILRRPGLDLAVKDISGGQLLRNDYPDQAELIARLPAGGSVTYRIDW